MLQCEELTNALQLHDITGFLSFGTDFESKLKANCDKNNFALLSFF